MQIESILIFIVFVVISSLASKRKEAQQRQRQQQKQTTKTTAASSRPTPQKQGKRTLQDLFREMQQELESEYRQAQEAAETRKKSVAAQAKAPESQKPFTYESTNPEIGVNTARTLKEKKPLQTSLTKKTGPIYKDEIKDIPLSADIQLTQEAVLQGVIFSEILGKPKARK